MKTVILHRRRPKPTIAIRSALAIRYKTSIINPDGSVASTRPWKKNLILDQGLNNLATQLSTNLFNVAVVGTGTDPVKRDSASVTLSRTGTTVTASGAFFGSGDVGRLLKFDSGEEVYINGYTDSTHVETVDSGSIASSEGTIWYVNQTGLQTESKRTSTYRAEAGDNSSTWDGTDTFTHQRTFQFSAEAGSVTYTEIGWSHSGTVAGNLFGRDLIPGGGDSLTVGQQYQVVVQMTVRFSPVTAQAVADVGTGGFNTAGSFIIESVAGIHGTINSGGSTVSQSGYALEPSQNIECRAASATWTPGAAAVNTNITPPAGADLTLVAAGYVSGSFERDNTATFGINAANGTIHGFIFGSTSSSILLSLKFTAPQTKDSAHSLTVNFHKTWGRELVN